MLKILILTLLAFLLSQHATSQLPPDKSIGSKLTVRFHKNIEFLGFLYFIVYEGTNIETKTLEIDGKEILEKYWQSYGYNFYQKYKQFAESKNAATAMSVAEHLWLSDFWLLLLQTEDFPQAKLTSTIDEKCYIAFSKSKDKDEAKKNTEVFLSSLNELYREIDFDRYLTESSVYYQSAINQIQENIPSTEFISFAEIFYRKTFNQYVLIPSLTIPKGMGFGPCLSINGETKVYNIFGAVDFQNFSNTSSLDMGFGNKDKLRELSIHEFGHSFINPEFSFVSKERIKITSSLFEPIRSVMENQGYNNWGTCLNEHFVRAGEIVIAEKMGDSLSVENLKNEYLNTRKFIYIPTIIEELKRFDTDQTDNYQNVLNRVLLKLEKEVSRVNQSKQETEFSSNPRDAKFHTADMTLFWEIFDQNYPKLPGDILQQEYIDKGSIGLKGFIRNRIESGKNLSKIVRGEIKYYEYVRPFTLSIDKTKERFYECFENLKNIYPQAVFPDVYFVIGANNTGGTIFDKGLIIGAEKFGKSNNEYKAVNDIEYVDEVVAHELIHFQQNYAKDNSLLAQSIKEGAADFICELIAGSHINKDIFFYGDNHKKELWDEFKLKMYQNDWTGWLYYNKDKSRPKDLGYWAGYQICKAYYDKSSNKQKAIFDILNIDDFNLFL